MAYPYASADDVFRRFNPIRTMVGTGVSDVATVDISSVYIADAQGIVDAHLGYRYTLPLVPEPIITHVTADLAIYNICVDRLPRIPEFMQRRYERAMNTLVALRDGKMVLNPQSNTVVTTGDSYAWSSTQSYHTVFSPVLRDVDQREDHDFVRDEQSTRRGFTECHS